MVYKKAVQTISIWAFAYEVPDGGYALSLSYTGICPILETEPEFSCIQALETEMQKIAPLERWEENLFDKIILQGEISHDALQEQ